MFCILLANLRKWVKIPYNLLGVNEDFESKRNAEITLLDSFFSIRKNYFTRSAKAALAASTPEPAVTFLKVSTALSRSEVFLLPLSLYNEL